MPRACTLTLALACGCTDPVAQLDASGRAMLEPMRLEALRPDALVAQLELAPSSVVADVGAGPGFLTLYLAHAVPSGGDISANVAGAAVPGTSGDLLVLRVQMVAGSSGYIELGTSLTIP